MFSFFSQTNHLNYKISFIGSIITQQYANQIHNLEENLKVNQLPMRVAYQQILKQLLLEMHHITISRNTYGPHQQSGILLFEKNELKNVMSMERQSRCLLKLYVFLCFIGKNLILFDSRTKMSNLWPESNATKKWWWKKYLPKTYFCEFTIYKRKLLTLHYANEF